jgi:hypothetical protein
VGNGLGNHPDLAPVAADMRAEWRAETEQATADAAAQWRHQRTLHDWLTERQHAGDRIAITIHQQRFAGLVSQMGPDLIVLHAVFGRVDIHLTPGLSFFIELVDHATHGGERADTQMTFRDALALRDGQPNTTVGTIHDPEGVDGTLYVGRDFVSVVAKLGAETVIPLQYVSWCSATRTL